MAGVGKAVGVFIDDLLNKVVVVTLPRYMHKSADRDTPHDLREMASNPVFDVSNVCRYYYEESAQEYWGRDDFPCVMLPYERMTFEAGYGKFIRSSVYGETSFGELTRNRRIVVFAQKLAAQDYLFTAGDYLTDKHILSYPIAYMRVQVDEHGAVTYMSEPTALTKEELSDSDAIRSILSSVRSHFYVALLSLSFINTTNVVIDRHEPLNPFRKEKVRAAKKPKAQGAYHTIRIVAPGSTTRRATVARQQGASSAPVAIVRGHFAHYGPEYGRGLLFGKLAGRFWVSPHSRGTDVETALAEERRPNNRYTVQVKRDR